MRKSTSGIGITKETGKLTKHKRGFGFVTPLSVIEAGINPKDNIGKDIFIAKSNLGGAMNGDIVEVVITKGPGTREKGEARVVRIIEHAIKEVTGTFNKSGKFGFIVPEGRDIDEDIYVKQCNFNGAKDGDKVTASLITYPEPGLNAEGIITEIVARKGEPGADIKAAARSKGYSFSFPEEVSEEAKTLQSEAGRLLCDMGRKAPKALNSGGCQEASNQYGYIAGGRRDLRNKTIFTIDGADSKDFDDAVSIEKLDNGNYLLGVHIADVSHYVTEGSFLDKEAFSRGTSVYLINQVIPMLPFELSNDICSLNPEVPRFTLSVDMEIEPKGDIIDHEIYESVIESKGRLVYDDVSDIIENTSECAMDKAMSEGFSEYRKKCREDALKLKDDILLMAELADILRKKRDARGSLDFNVGEAEIHVDEKGVASEILPASRRSSNRMIEEFMLAANETVAEHFYWLDAPFVYRIHERPDPDRMQEFRQFLRGFGIPLKGNSDNIHPLTLARILNRVNGTKYENVVGTVMLRSMQKAYYGTECEGHFGLSLKYYCHFTSPIRRYPDLMIHRIIKEYLKSDMTKERVNALKKVAQEASEQSSMAERKALEIERDVDKMKKCEFMGNHIGEAFEGVVSGVNSYGMFVELPNTVEGMVRMENLIDDYYDCEAEKYRLVGRLSGKIYSLGQTVTVMTDYVSIENREIDFILHS